MGKHLSFFTRLHRRLDPIWFKWNLSVREEKSNARVWKQPLPKLSKEEESLFDTTWKGWGKDSWMFYKALGVDLDAELVPNDYYQWAEHILNLRWGALFLQHKCCLKHIIPSANRPETILQKIDGHFVKENDLEITKSEARQILVNHNTFVAKLAFGTGGGRGVRKIDLNNDTDSDTLLDKILIPSDMIYQKILEQSSFMSSFNASSINTIRFLTLNINGVCSVLSAFIRIGGKGAFVDNFSSGTGVLVGLNQEGALHEFGIDKSFHKIYTSPSGLGFAGVIIPERERIKEIVCSFHRHIPYAELIGWDIAIAKDGTPIVIEINLDSAEIEAHQIFNGPVFGERFKEVRDHIREKEKRIHHATIVY